MYLLKTFSFFLYLPNKNERENIKTEKFLKRNEKKKNGQIILLRGIQQTFKIEIFISVVIAVNHLLMSSIFMFSEYFYFGKLFN